MAHVYNLTTQKINEARLRKIQEGQNKEVIVILYCIVLYYEALY